jgi:DNA (cytosine-5)-methyltransferase 1
MIVKYPEEVVGTITTAFGAKNYSNHQELMEGSVVVLENDVRRLSPEECELLQGFPSGWTWISADEPRYKQMGNAVTVNVIKWIGGRL